MNYKGNGRMFEWKYLFEEEILERADSYVADVNNVKRVGDKITCDVRGTCDYYVTVTLSNGDVELISCNCPYEFHCKHEAALLYYIEEHPDLLDDEVKDGFDDADAILSSIDCHTLRRFIKEELSVNENLRNNFMNEFRTKCRVDKRFYRDKLERIFENAKSREFSMHGYYDLDYVGGSLLRFMDEDIGRIASLGEDAVACELLNHIMKKLDDDMYLNFDSWYDIASRYDEYGSSLVESDKLDESQRYYMERMLRKVSNFI